MWLFIKIIYGLDFYFFNLYFWNSLILLLLMYFLLFHIPSKYCTCINRTVCMIFFIIFLSFIHSDSWNYNFQVCTNTQFHVRYLLDSYSILWDPFTGLLIECFNILTVFNMMMKNILHSHFCSSLLCFICCSLVVQIHQIVWYCNRLIERCTTIHNGVK